jgi:hypothetical protein
MLATFQSQVVVKSSWNSEISGQAFDDPVVPFSADQQLAAPQQTLRSAGIT